MKPVILKIDLNRMLFVLNPVLCVW